MAIFNKKIYWLIVLVTLTGTAPILALGEVKEDIVMGTPVCEQNPQEPTAGDICYIDGAPDPSALGSAGDTFVFDLRFNEQGIQLGSDVRAGFSVLLRKVPIGDARPVLIDDLRMVLTGKNGEPISESVSFGILFDDPLTLPGDPPGCIATVSCGASTIPKTKPEFDSMHAYGAKYTIVTSGDPTIGFRLSLDDQLVVGGGRASRFPSPLIFHTDVGFVTNDLLSIEKLINHRARPTADKAAELLVGTRYRAEYKVTNNSPNRLYSVQVFEGGQLVCNLYTLDPGESKQRYHCANSKDVLAGLNNVPAKVTAKVSGSNQKLANQTNAYYNGFGNEPGKLKVTHYVNNKNADTGASAVTANGNQAEIVFRVENTGSIKLYRVNTFHDPASPVNSGWQQQCFIGTLDPGQVRYCKRTINVTEGGLNKVFGRAQGEDANVNPTGFVNASNPTYFNVVLP